MKRVFILASVASLSFLPFAFANETASHKTQTHTLTGCLSGPNTEGVYTLKSGAKDIEVGGAADLKDHVGQKVKVSGLWAKSGAEIGEKSEKTSAKAESHERHFKAESVQRVADTCTASSSASHSSTNPSR